MAPRAAIATPTADDEHHRVPRRLSAAAGGVPAHQRQQGAQHCALLQSASSRLCLTFVCWPARPPAPLQYLHAENALGCRFPIGKTDQVEAWAREEIMGFWGRHYFPGGLGA